MPDDVDGGRVLNESTGVQADDAQRFAADLRKLRVEAGTPTYDRLSSESGVSKSVLADALAGRTLPSARTVEAIVRTCRGDASSWLDRRDALARNSSRGSTAISSGDTSSLDKPAARTGVWSRRKTLLPIALAFVVGAAVSGVAASLIVTQVYAAQLAAARMNAGQITVATGADPASTACVDDARVATGDTRADNSLLEIVWSDKCQAGWGRITRYDGLNQGNTVTIAIYPQTAPDGPDRQDVTEHDVQGAYTTLVVRPSPDTLLCADGSFTVDGKRIDLGDPLCI